MNVRLSWLMIAGMLVGYIVAQCIGSFVVGFVKEWRRQKRYGR